LIRGKIEIERAREKEGEKRSLGELSETLRVHRRSPDFSPLKVSNEIDLDL
jgi:hypothetical protein